MNLIRKGRLFDDKHPDRNRGWVIGDYIDDPVFRTDRFQLKYQHQRAGDFREAKEVMDDQAQTLCILIHGECRAKFVETEQEVFLKSPGEYIRWGPDSPHEFEYITDCLIITVRW